MISLPYFCHRLILVLLFSPERDFLKNLCPKRSSVQKSMWCHTSHCKGGRGTEGVMERGSHSQCGVSWAVGGLRQSYVDWGRQHFRKAGSPGPHQHFQGRRKNTLDSDSTCQGPFIVGASVRGSSRKSHCWLLTGILFSIPLALRALVLVLFENILHLYINFAYFTFLSNSFSFLVFVL